MKVTKVCERHGETEFFVSTTKIGKDKGRVRYYCVKCNSEATQKRRDKIKMIAVEYKGGKCEKCGYNKCIDALDFHHIDPSKKEFGICGSAYTKS